MPTHANAASHTRTCQFLLFLLKLSSSSSSSFPPPPPPPPPPCSQHGDLELVFYTWVARSRSESSSFTASALNKLSPPPPPPSLLLLRLYSSHPPTHTATGLTHELNSLSLFLSLSLSLSQSTRGSAPLAYTIAY